MADIDWWLLISMIIVRMFFGTLFFILGNRVAKYVENNHPRIYKFILKLRGDKK